MRKLTFIFMGAVLTLLAAPAWGQTEIHLGAGLGAGTAGAGAELAVPLHRRAFVLKAGGDWLGLPYTLSRDFPTTQIQANVARAAHDLERQGRELHSRIPQQMTVTADARLDLSSAHAVVEWYPSPNSGFHVSGGAYFAFTGEALRVTADADAAFWDAVEGLRAEMASYGTRMPESLTANMDGRSFEIRYGRAVEAAARISRLRPYLGVGIGRSIPEGRVGFQIEAGAWYHGRIALESPSEVPYDEAGHEVDFDPTSITRYALWPVVTARLTFRIF